QDRINHRRADGLGSVALFKMALDRTQKSAQQRIGPFFHRTASSKPVAPVAKQGHAVTSLQLKGRQQIDGAHLEKVRQVEGAPATAASQPAHALPGMPGVVARTAMQIAKFDAPQSAA